MEGVVCVDEAIPLHRGEPDLGAEFCLGSSGLRYVQNRTTLARTEHCWEPALTSLSLVYSIFPV